ncbi:uncharacterized protein LOC143376839 isoform X2 [Andrena cerasifolii]|uniref:uncharacterized protein LOC143376839 isoform X1 n=1 Tax=Andrena cerasifolii TaxID=2819439 RepID=UPI0040384115
MLKLLLIFILINVRCQAHLRREYTLNTALEQTTSLFEKLRSDYASESPSSDVLDKINGEVAEHVRNVSEGILNRRKRALSEDFNKGIDILKGFQDFSQLNFSDAKDVEFFSLQSGHSSTWFAVILDPSKISLYQINDDAFSLVTTYPLTSGTQVTVNSCSYGALLIIQNQDGSILVLRFTRANESYYLYPIQDFESNDMTHLTIWHGMNQLYLGVASRSNILIYIWFGDYFDLAQVINHGADRLIPFYSKGFMYLAATGPATLIFKYYLQYDKFVVKQKLPLSRDVSSFPITEGHFSEHFLCLSTESVVVVYKEIRDRFVPFQRISARSTVPMISKKAILLLSLRNDTMLSYQYDGWRFVELNVKLSGVRQFRQVALQGKELLLVRYKNNAWSLKQPLWTTKRSYKDLQEEIRVWNIDAMKAAQRTVKEIPDAEEPIRILRGHIDQLFVRNVNEHNSEALRNVSNQYRRLVSKLQEQKAILSNKLHSGNLTLTSFHAKKIRVNCKPKCKVSRLNVKGNPSLLSKLKKKSDQNQNLTFKAASINELKNWKCPLVSLPIEDIIVGESINGISLDDLQRNVLKVIGNQEVSGEHSFTRLNVTNAFVPLDIASNMTKQEVHAREIRAKELILTDGGSLLPLNGSPTTITGSLIASKVKVKSSIFLQGSLSGSWRNSLLPLTIIPEPLTLNGDVVLEEATIENLRSEELIASKAGSVKDILSNAISLRGNVPVSLTLSSERMKWSNVTLRGPQTWITANSQNEVAISGRKHFLRNVEITKSSYENLNLPGIETALCGTTVIAPEIKTTTLAVDNITVNRLNSTQAFGNLGANDSALLFKPLNVSTDRFYLNVTAKNISAEHVDNVDLPELIRLANSWTKPNILKASIKATDLVIGTLRLPAQFRIELPKVVGNIITEQNLRAGSINGINVADFLANAIKLEDMISLGNITFGNGLQARHVHASQLPLNFSKQGGDNNLHRKRISGELKANAISLPYSFAFAENEAPPNIVVKGSATFSSEPTVRKANRVDLAELFPKIWMSTNATHFYGKNLHFANVSVEGNVTLNNRPSTLDLDTWRNISARVLSRTKPQRIVAYATLSSVETPFITGSNNSTIQSSVSDFNDVFENALLRDKDQKVRGKWSFSKLKVLGKLHAQRKINDMDLKTDVLRHDSEETVVTGKKTVEILTAENLNGLHFNQWARNALTEKDKPIIIKGRKRFNTVSVNNMNVSGTVMGHKIEEALLKSTNQMISGQKEIQGPINASALVIDGLVNDVNLTNLMSQQVRKEKPLQRLKAPIEFQSALKIAGNLTINGSYGGAELKDFYRSYLNVEPVAEKMRNYSRAGETIGAALRSQAVYINKLEVVSDTNATFNRNVTLETGRCRVENSSKLCASENVVNIILKSDRSDFILLKSISLGEDEFIVWIKFDSVSIHLYNSVEKHLSHLKDLHIPKILDAFVESLSQSLWIVLRLTSQTLVLHYQQWGDFQEYALPATEVFAVSRAPNEQLLLLLSDGVWSLEGLASPQHIIDIPLEKNVEAFSNGLDYYLKCTSGSNSTLMKARYAGN